MKTSPPGAQAETQVSSLLQQQGWQLLDRNWSCRWGALELVLAKEDRRLVVEGKGRRSLGWGPWSVDPTKLRRLGRAVRGWRAGRPMQADWLLQVAVAVVPLPPAQGAPRWYRLDRLC